MYGGEFWGHTEQSALEHVLLKFYKYALELPLSSPNLMGVLEVWCKKECVLDNSSIIIIPIVLQDPLKRKKSSNNHHVVVCFLIQLYLVVNAPNPHPPTWTVIST